MPGHKDTETSPFPGTFNAGLVGRVKLHTSRTAPGLLWPRAATILGCRLCSHPLCSLGTPGNETGRRNINATRGKTQHVSPRRTQQWVRTSARGPPPISQMHRSSLIQSQPLARAALAVPSPLRSGSPWLSIPRRKHRRANGRV